jgi:hypothetical protein
MRPDKTAVPYNYAQIAGAQGLRRQGAPIPQGQDAAPGTILTEPTLNRTNQDQ